MMFGFVKSIVHGVDNVARGTTRAIKSVPGIGHVVKAGESAIKGPIGDLTHSIVSNPFVSVALYPVAIPANLALSAAKGGVQGAADAAKKELANPVRRVALKGIGYIFPPAAAADKALEATNRLVAASESGDPVEAAKAMAQLGAAKALADLGDAHAREVMGLVGRAQAGSAKQVANAQNVSSLMKRLMGQAQPIKSLPPAQKTQAQAVVRTVGKVLTKAQLAPHTLNAAEQTLIKELQGLDASKTPIAKEVLSVLQKGSLKAMVSATAELNKAVIGYNSKDPSERAAWRKRFADLQAAVKRGDPKAAKQMTELRRRAAALRAAKRYKLDKRGYARRVA
jgi:hypothetical protein